MGNQQVSTLYPIPGYGDYYRVDREGNVYSLRFNKIRKLKQHKHYGRSRNPYLRMRLWKDFYLVHRIIMSAKLGRQLEPHEQVNHINADTLDNRFENLEVVAHKENVAHAVENGLYQSGEDWYRARM